MNKLIYKNLDVEDILNIESKFKIKRNKIKKLIGRSISLVMIIFTIHYLEIFILKLLYIIFFILCFLIYSNKNTIICANIIRNFLKRNIKTIEFDKKNIKIYDGKNIVLNSYDKINELIEYKNLIEINYTPIKNKEYNNQIVLIPKDIFKTQNELLIFKELIISKISKKNFKAHDNDFKIIEINKFEKFKNKIYLILFFILLIINLIFSFQYIILT